MKTTSFLFILLAMAFQACQPPAITTSFWVSGIKTECDAGASEMICLQVYNGIEIEKATWENLYIPIAGFEFEDGYLQHIEVKEERVENPPADGVSVTYTLVKVLDKQQDIRLGLNDIWVCKTIAEQPIDSVSQAPNLEINLRKMAIMGSNGCNSYNGKIETLDASKIKIGPMAETRMMCADMRVPDAFSVAIGNVAAYKREGLMLRFYDEQGSELLAFLKVD